MMRVFRLRAVFALAALLVGFVLTLPASVSAQQPTPSVDEQVAQISRNLYCPVCSGVPLDVCDTQACVQWRELIRTKVEQGENENQIRQYFISQYGDRVLGAPPPEGFNLSAYLVPALVLLLGAALIAWTARGWLKRAPAAAPPVFESALPPETAERIARELKARE